MLCIIALFVFGILSIFSAKYRPYARASFDCVFRRLTLRPCNTTLEEQVKSETVAALLPRLPPLAKFVNSHWEGISWAFTILLVVSLIYTAYGIYNFVEFGTCDPTDPGKGCPYGVLLGQDPTKLAAPSSLVGITAGNKDAKVTVVEFGCFSCPFTKRAEPGVQELLDKDGQRIYYVFKNLPIPAHAYSRESSLASICANQSGKYWEYRSWLFDNQQRISQEGVSALLEGAASLGADSKNFSLCMQSTEVSKWLDARIAEGNASKIYYTPTFFVNGKPLVGPLQYSQLKTAVDEAYAKG